MDKNQANQLNQQPDNKSNKRFVGKERRNPQIDPGIIHPGKRLKNNPLKSGNDIDPTRPKPELNNPTRVDELPPIINRK